MKLTELKTLLLLRVGSINRHISFIMVIKYSKNSKLNQSLEDLRMQAKLKLVELFL